METVVSTTITDTESKEVVLEVDHIGISQFRLMTFGKDGLASIHGKLPWKKMEKPYKEWIKKWAETHAGEFEALVRQYRPETVDEEIIELLRCIENEAPKLLAAVNGKKDTAVASHMLHELLRAVATTVKKASNVAKSIWEFSPTDNNDSQSVLGWLFRRR